MGTNLGHSLLVELARNDSLHPYVCANVSDSTSRIHNFIYETAHLRSPVNRVGQILDGEWTTYHLGMVSRDPDAFPNPDDMDLTRDRSKATSWNEISAERICPGKALSIKFLTKLVQQT